MKTFKYLFMPVVALMMGFATFTSCSSDNDDKPVDKKDVPSEESHTKVSKYARLELKCYFGLDFFKYFDVKVSYSDLDGSLKTENVDASNCTKGILPVDTNPVYTYKQNVKYEKLPFDVNYKVEVTPKAGVTETSGSVGMGGAYTLSLFDQSSTYCDGKWSMPKYVKQETPVNVTEYVKQLKEKGKIMERKITLNTNGTVTVNDTNTEK